MILTYPVRRRFSKSGRAVGLYMAAVFLQPFWASRYIGAGEPGNL